MTFNRRQNETNETLATRIGRILPPGALDLPNGAAWRIVGEIIREELVEARDAQQAAGVFAKKVGPEVDAANAMFVQALTNEGLYFILLHRAKGEDSAADFVALNPAMHRVFTDLRVQ